MKTLKDIAAEVTTQQNELINKVAEYYISQGLTSDDMKLQYIDGALDKFSHWRIVDSKTNHVMAEGWLRYEEEGRKLYVEGRIPVAVQQ